MDFRNDTWGGKLYCFSHKRCRLSSVYASSDSGRVTYSRIVNPVVKDAKAVENNLISKPHTSCIVFKPPDLKTTCMNMIVDNILAVDSLEGIPELIGEELFNFCNAKGLFKSENAHVSPKILKIFTLAYKEAVLQTLNLSAQWMFVSMNSDFFHCFKHVETIDLSCCKIGDTHAILLYLSELSFLKKLFLHNNCLSIEGVKQLSVAHRRKKIGLESLEILRLDGNLHVNANAVLYLSSLPNLKIIIFTDNGNFSKMLKFLDKRKVKNFGMCPYPALHHKAEWECNNCSNVGWAASVIECHLQEVKKYMQRDLSQHKINNSSPSFYSRHSKKVKKTSCSSKLDGDQIVVCRCEYNCLPRFSTFSHDSILMHHTLEKTKGVKQSTYEYEPCISRQNIGVDKSVLDIYRPVD